MQPGVFGVGLQVGQLDHFDGRSVDARRGGWFAAGCQNWKLSETDSVPK
jgi:hypothetical protein